MKYNNLLVLGLVLFLFSVTYATITSINLINPSNKSWIATPAPTFQFNATSDINSTFSCTLYINNTPYGTNASVLNGTLTSIIANASLIDGSYQWYINCTDINGTVQSTIYIVGIDTIPPNIIITTPKNGSILNYSTVTLNWTGSDTGSGIAYYEISNDTISWTNVGTNNSVTYTYSDGLHTLYVRAYDNAGNVNQTNVTFIVDTTPPTIVLNSPTPINYSTTSIVANWTGSDATSGIAYYNVSLDGGAWINVGLNTTYNLTNLSQGSHTFTVLAIDKAGNSNQSTVSFVVDTIAPNVTITYPAPNSYLNTSTVVVNWTGSDNNTGIKSYYVSLDGGTPVNVGLNTTYTFNSLADGTHTVSVQAVDYAGNSNVTSVTFIVDTTPPTIVLNSPTPINYSTTSIVANWTGSDATSGIAYYNVSLDGGAWINVGLNTTYNLTNLSQGSHTFTVLAIDKAGNSNQSTVSFVVDTIAPNVTITYPAPNSYLNTSTVVVNWTGSDNNTGIKSYYVSLDGGTPVNVGLNTTYTFNSLADGTHTVSVQAVDYAGNSNVTSVTFIVDTTPPTLSVSANATNSTWVNYSVSVSATASDATSGVSALYYCTSTTGVCTPSLPYTIGSNVVVSTEGTTYVVFKVVDNAGNSNESIYIAKIDETPPTTNFVATLINGTQYTNNTWTNQGVSVTISATDTLSSISAINYVLDGVSYKVTSSSVTVPISGDGIHTLVFNATDVAGNTNQNTTLVIKLDTVPPSVTVPVQNYTDPTSTYGAFTANVTDDRSGINAGKVFISLSNVSDPTSYSTPVPMNWTSGTATASLFIGNIADPFFGPGAHYVKVCAYDVAGNLNCSTTTIQDYIEIINSNSSKNLFASQGITLNISDPSTGLPITTPAINPITNRYNYEFSKNGFTVVIYNTTVSRSKLLNMTSVNLTLNLNSLLDLVKNQTSNLSQIVAVWTDIPWVNATEYSYGEVVMNATYNTLFYCTNTTSCTQILQCNASQVNLSNYFNVIPNNGACYLNVNNKTIVYVDHFSGVVGARDATPPNVTLTCSPSEVYIGDLITCTCNATDNVAVASIEYTKHPDTSIVGTFVTTCKAVDTAGNVATANFTYTVKSSGAFNTGPVQVPPTYTMVFDKVVNETRMVFNSSGIAVNGIDLVVNKTFTNVQIKIQKIDTVNFEKPNGKVYQYLKFDLTNIDDSGIKSVTLQFKVDKLWLESNGVKPDEVYLMRYSNGQWNKLDTTQIGSDDKYVYYKAISPGLSYYAITAVKLSETQNLTTNVTQSHNVTPSNENNNVTNKPTSNQTPVQPVSSVKYNMNLIFGIIAVIAAACIIGAIYFMNHKKVNVKSGRRKRHK